MNLAVLVLGLLLIAFLMAAAAIWSMVTRRTALDRVTKRADVLRASPLEGSADAFRADRTRSRDEERWRPLGLLDRRLREAGVDIPAERFALYMGLATVGIGVVFPVLGGVTGLLKSFPAFFLVLLFALAAGVGAPLAWISRRAARRIADFEAQFPSALDIFVRGLRAGHPVSSALDLLVTELPNPISHEFSLVRSEMSYGADLRAALGNLARRMNTPDVNMFVVSVAVQSETGGNLADILEGLARVIRERASMVLKVRALSSEGRMSAVLLSVLPVGTFSFIFATQPKIYLDVANDPIFFPAIAGLIVVYLMGLVVINRLVQIKV